MLFQTLMHLVFIILRIDGFQEPSERHVNSIVELFFQLFSNRISVAARRLVNFHPDIGFLLPLYPSAEFQLQQPPPNPRRHRSATK